MTDQIELAAPAERPAVEPRVNAARIAADLQQFGELGATGAGVTRLAYTPAERQAHDLMARRMRDAGLTVSVDAFGNSYGLRPGTDPSLPAIGFGSHLDTVPNGGRFDGAVGTLGALEVMRALQDAGVETRHPLLLVVFAAEEGARFGAPCLGSKAITGILSERDLDRLKDANGVTLRSAIASVGLDPGALATVRWPPRYLAAFLEMHIEQARVLETEGKGVGLIDFVAGSTRFRLTLSGRADHSGATPMRLRQDALAAAAEIVLGLEALARDPRRRSTVATVGRLELSPNSITTVPARAVLGIDVRDVDSDRQREVARQAVDLARRVGERRRVGVEVELITDNSPVVLPVWLRQLLGEACHELDVEFRVMNSGAGHDAAYVSTQYPAAMIFVPSREGISHSPEEWTSVADVARGAEVMLRSVLHVDRRLSTAGT
ncbi:MAG: Zn-dependent hydrolase [Chloroflexi bacterium]|nr:Zn-dependent hydrolase [Chloroflexota bacterium]